MMPSHSEGKKLGNIDSEMILQLTPRIYVFSAKAFGSRELGDHKPLIKGSCFTDLKLLSLSLRHHTPTSSWPTGCSNYAHITVHF